MSMGPREHSPDHSIRADGPVATGGSSTINDRTGLYIAIIALALAGMGLGYEMSQNSSRADLRQLQEQVVDAKIAAAVAQAKAEANEAKVKARVAEDSVKSICAALKASQFKNVDCH